MVFFNMVTGSTPCAKAAFAHRFLFSDSVQQLGLPCWIRMRQRKLVLCLRSMRHPMWHSICCELARAGRNVLFRTWVTYPGDEGVIR